MVFLPFFSAAAARTIAASEACDACGFGSAGASPSASFQAVSAGRISVAIWPGGASAACTARAPSAATVSALGEE